MRASLQPSATAIRGLLGRGEWMALRARAARVRATHAAVYVTADLGGAAHRVLVPVARGCRPPANLVLGPTPGAWYRLAGVVELKGPGKCRELAQARRLARRKRSGR